MPALSRQDHPLTMAVPAIDPASKDPLQQAPLRHSQSLRGSQDTTQGYSPGLSGALEEFRQLQRGRRKRVEDVRSEPFNRLEIFWNTFVSQVIAGEHEPVARSVVAADTAASLVGGDLGTDDDQA